MIPDIEKQTIKGVVIPYSPKEAIYICAFDNGSYSHYEAPDKYLNALNRYCYIFEKSFGNGLIFSLNADCARRYLK